MQAALPTNNSALTSMAVQKEKGEQSLYRLISSYRLHGPKTVKRQEEASSPLTSRHNSDFFANMQSSQEHLLQ